VFLFIFESIGTSELILIGIIALIFLGPRKLPQIAKTIGKTMADFRGTANEFKSTWEKEVDFEEEAEALRTGILPEPDPVTVPREVTSPETSENSVLAPSVKEIDKKVFDDLTTAKTPDAETQQQEETEAADPLSDKRNWL
jgi:Tat protein translocase TatB subunit